MKTRMTWMTIFGISTIVIGISNTIWVLMNFLFVSFKRIFPDYYPDNLMVRSGILKNMSSGDDEYAKYSVKKKKLFFSYFNGFSRKSLHQGILLLSSIVLCSYKFSTS